MGTVADIPRHTQFSLLSLKNSVMQGQRHAAANSRPNSGRLTEATTRASTRSCSSSSPPLVPQPLQPTPRKQAHGTTVDDTFQVNAQSPWCSSPPGSPKASSASSASGGIDWLDAAISRNRQLIDGVTELGSASVNTAIRRIRDCGDDGVQDS